MPTAFLEMQPNRVWRLADVTPKDVAAGREAMEHARIAVAPTRALCDLVIAERVAPDDINFQFENWRKDRARIQGHPALATARKVLTGLEVFHFPIAFPEVFLRSRPGFDVIIGNPPWDKPMIEVHAFWARHYPGLRGFGTAEREARLKRLPKERPDLQTAFEAEQAVVDRERAVLMAGFYPGMGKGHADLYRAFSWRFWQLIAERGGAWVWFFQGQRS